EHVPYDGGDPATKDLLGGHIDVIAIDVPQIKSQVEAGEIKSLALLNDERSEYLPDVPTVEEAGYNEIENVGTWKGLTVPKDTPDEIVNILSEAFLDAA